MPKMSSVPSVDRTLTILELLAQSRCGLTLSDISRKLTLPKSSVYLLIKTLEKRGYLKNNRVSRKYHFGLKLVSLSHTALENLDLREQAMPFLQDLMLRTGLTVHMAILEQTEAVIIEKIEAPGMLRLATWVGRRLDANSSGLGKVLLAFAPEPTINQYFNARLLARHNKNTIASSNQLIRELKKVRQLGYAFDNEENEIGFRCIGAPIYDSANRMISAVSVAGTTVQIPKERVAKLASTVKVTAAEVSAHLGHELNAEAERIVV